MNGVVFRSRSRCGNRTSFTQITRCCHLSNITACTVHMASPVINSMPYYNRQYAPKNGHKSQYRKHTHFTSFRRHNTSTQISFSLATKREPEQELETLGIQITPRMTQSQLESIYDAFLLTIDISNGHSYTNNVQKASRIWDAVFNIDLTHPSVTPQVSELQQKLFSIREEFVYFLLDHLQYKIYRQSVFKLYSEHALFKDVDISKSEEMFLLLKFQDDSIDYSALERYCRDEEVSIEMKRYAITTMVRKASVNRSDHNNKNEPYRLYIKTFFELYHKLEGSWEGFGTVGIGTYKKAFNVLHSIPNIQKYIPFPNGREYFTVLSYFLDLLVKFRHTNIAMIFWEELQSSEYVTPKDLTKIMEALFKSGNYAQALEIFQKWELLLKDDSQIAILLGIAEKERDWKSLQEQFEDMYGRGTLPHDIHYSIVMNALATIGAKDEVHKLFQQLLRRNFKPNSGIVAALINSELYHGQYKQAEDIITKYANADEPSGSIAVAYLYEIIFTSYYRANDLESALLMFGRIRNSKSFHLLSTQSVTTIIGLCKKNFALKDIELIKQLLEDTANDFNHVSLDEVNCAIITAYTKFSLYEKADSLSTEVLKSISQTHPFLCGKVYTAKLANYSRLLQVRDKFLSVREKELIQGQIKLLIKAFHKNHVIPESRWYVELIKYYIFRDEDIEIATDIIKFLKKSPSGLLNEQHFHPIMKYHLLSGDNNEVLEMFKEMTVSNVTTSALSYMWLLKGLLRLDMMKGNNFVNSTNLLKAVYDMNGLRFDISGRNTPPVSQIPKGNLFKNVEALTNMTMSYIVTKNDPSGEALLFNFLEQVRENANDKVTSTFKYPLYRNIYKYYIKQGNDVQAAGLVGSIFKDIVKTITKYAEQSKQVATVHNNQNVPRYFEDLFQYFASIKVKQSFGSDDELYTITRMIRDNEIHLSSRLLNNLVAALLQTRSDVGFELALQICESSLVQGNWKLISVEKSKGYVLKALMYYLSSNTELAVLREKYHLILDYYMTNVFRIGENFEGLMMNRTQILQKSLTMYNSKFSENSTVSVEDVLDKDYEFFNPPTTPNDYHHINNAACVLLRRALKSFDRRRGRNAVFGKMDKYPSTIEYLISCNTRIDAAKRFMQEIDEIEPATISDVKETRRSRDERIVRALKKVQRQNHPEKEDRFNRY